MRALETSKSSADSLTAARNLRTTFRGIAVACSAVVVFLPASTASGQQGWSRPQSRGEPATSTRSSSSKDMLDQRLEQLLSSGQKNSEAASRQSDPERIGRPSFTRQENADSIGRSDLTERFQDLENQPAIQRVTLQSSNGSPDVSQTQATPAPVQSAESLTSLSSTPEATSASPPVSTEINTATAGAVPEMFLDLTQETPSSGAADTSQTSGHRSPEVSMGSSPTQVLMRAVAWIVIALCLFSLTILGLRRWQRQRGLLPTTNTRSRVLETLSLGPGRTVSLIELAGFRALVASDTGGIRSLVLAPVSFHDELMQVGQPPDQPVSLANLK